MIYTLKFRKRLAFMILAISIVGAIYIATPNDGGNRQRGRINAVRERGGAITRLIDELNTLELAHIAGHISIFGGVAFLLGGWGAPGERGNAKLAWSYVIVGALLMEAVQGTVGWSDDSAGSLIKGITFDLCVDAISATIGLLLAQLMVTGRQTSGESFHR